MIELIPSLLGTRICKESKHVYYYPDRCAKVAKHFGMTLDELVNFKGKLPTEEKIEDKSTIEQLKLINELDTEDKQMVFRLIDTAITKKKFKDFFQQQLTQ